jgi:hypothetical protein
MVPLFSCVRVDSNHRPLGYEPNELPAAPRRIANIIVFLFSKIIKNPSIKYWGFFKLQ